MKSQFQIADSDAYDKCSNKRYARDRCDTISLLISNEKGHFLLGSFCLLSFVALIVLIALYSGEWWKLPSVPKTQPCQQQISAQTILGARTANTACSGRASQLGGYVYCHVCNARIQSAKARGTSGQADPTPCQSSAWSSSLSAPRRDYPQQNSLLSYFPVQRSRGDQKHRLEQYQISELNPGASPNLSCHPCEHCERPTCTSCSSTCESCQREYCTFCSTTSYAASFERKLCLECKKDENAAFMGDAMDLELD